MKVLVTHLCPTLRDPLDPPGSSVPGILHPWDSPGKNTGVSSHSLQGNLPDPRIKPESPALQAGCLPELSGKPQG